MGELYHSKKRSLVKLARQRTWFVLVSLVLCMGIWVGWQPSVASESHPSGSKVSSRAERSHTALDARGNRQPEARPGNQGTSPVKAIHPEGKQLDGPKANRGTSVQRRKPRASVPTKPDQRQKQMAQDPLYRLERDYPGMLQKPARAIPRLDRNHDGQVDPWEQEIAQERFAQLDRNRDGIVDPMERAMDFVDMDQYGRNGPLQIEPGLVRSQPSNPAVVPADKPVALKQSRSKSHLRKPVQPLDHPVQVSQTPSESPRRKAHVAPRHKSPAR